MAKKQAEKKVPYVEGKNYSIRFRSDKTIVYTDPDTGLQMEGHPGTLDISASTYREIREVRAFMERLANDLRDYFKDAGDQRKYHPLKDSVEVLVTWLPWERDQNDVQKRVDAICQAVESDFLSHKVRLRTVGSDVFIEPMELLRWAADTKENGLNRALSLTLARVQLREAKGPHEDPFRAANAERTREREKRDKYAVKLLKQRCPIKRGDGAHICRVVAKKLKEKDPEWEVDEKTVQRLAKHGGLWPAK